MRRVGALSDHGEKTMFQIIYDLVLVIIMPLVHERSNLAVLLLKCGLTGVKNIVNHLEEIFLPLDSAKWNSYDLFPTVYPAVALDFLI
jgi:hypothetical protein